MLLGAEVLQASGKGLTNSNSSNFLFTNFVIISMLAPLRCAMGRGRRSVELFTSLLAQLGDHHDITTIISTLQDSTVADF